MRTPPRRRDHRHHQRCGPRRDHRRLPRTDRRSRRRACHPDLRDHDRGHQPGRGLLPADGRRSGQGDHPMTRLVRIELLKLRTTRLTYGLLALAAALTALDAVLRAARAGHGKLAPLSTATGLTSVLTVTGFAMIIACVLGVTVSSGEFHHQTAALTYLEFPRRSRVLVAKLIAAALAGLVFGLIGSAVTTGIGLAFAAGHGYPVALRAVDEAGAALRD